MLPGQQNARLACQLADADGLTGDRSAQEQAVLGTLEFGRPGWLPTAVLGTGWSIAWLISFAVGSSPVLQDLAARASLGLIGWILAGQLIGAASRWADPALSPRRALLVRVGWPICIIIAIAGPGLLHLAGWGALMLGLCVSVAGAVVAVVLSPARSIPLDRVLVEAAAWATGWLWFGVTAWPEVFTRAAEGSA